MAICIIRSSVDQASVNIINSLIDIVEVEKEDDNLWRGQNFFIYSIEDMHIYHDFIDEEMRNMGLNPEIVIFASRHRSETGMECLTVHPIGNYAKAELGGREELVPAPAHEMFIALGQLLESGYRSSYEVTHHGPYLETPSFFIEIGSSEKEWVDKNKGRAVAGAVAHLLKNGDRDHEKTAISIGGGHYAPGQTDLASKEIAFGHMLPRYAYRELTEEITSEKIDEMIAKTIPEPDSILLESVPRWIRRIAERKELELL